MGGLHPGGGVCIQWGGLHPGGEGLHPGERGSASRGGGGLYSGALYPGGSASRGGGSASGGRGSAHPPPSYYGIGSTRGQYASYWNAFLFIFGRADVCWNFSSI